MRLSACASRDRPISATFSSSISTSAFVASVAVTTVPFLISVLISAHPLAPAFSGPRTEDATSGSLRAARQRTSCCRGARERARARSPICLARSCLHHPRVHVDPKAVRDVVRNHTHRPTFVRARGPPLLTGERIEELEQVVGRRFQLGDRPLDPLIHGHGTRRPAASVPWEDFPPGTLTARVAFTMGTAMNTPTNAAPP